MRRVFLPSLPLCAPMAGTQPGQGHAHRHHRRDLSLHSTVHHHVHRHLHDGALPAHRHRCAFLHRLWPSGPELGQVSDLSLLEVHGNSCRAEGRACAQVHRGGDCAGGHHDRAAGQHDGPVAHLDHGCARAHDPRLLGQGLAALRHARRRSGHHGRRLRCPSPMQPSTISQAWLAAGQQWPCC